MERLLELAKKAADQAGVYGQDTVSDVVNFENSKFKGIVSGIESGVSLLLKKDGRLGSAYTRNLVDREKLVRDALVSLRNGVEAGFELPSTRGLPELATFDPDIDLLTNAAMVDECDRVCAMLADESRSQVDVDASRSTSTVRVLNTMGTDLTVHLSSYECSVWTSYPGSGKFGGVRRWVSGKGFQRFPQEELDFVAGLYNASQTYVKPASGRIRVLFLPESMFVLVMRLAAATNGKSVYEKVSPLRDKVGHPILSDRVTLLDEPLNDSLPNARAFDDEGTPCRSMPIVEQGVLRAFYYDRFYAWKNGVEPTGHGNRGGVTTKVEPALEHIRLAPGTTSFADMLQLMGRGVVVAGFMGAQSGNILNGDYSIGLSPGLWVENGEIVGRVRDAMVAGNVYDTMREVLAVENKTCPSWLGRYPGMLFDNVSFTAKA